MAKSLLFVFMILVIAGINATTTEDAKTENMDKKIKNIAANIVNKWKSEGLRITKEKVEGWLDTLDQAQKGDTKNVKTHDNMVAGKEFQEVKKTLVKTFSNIGKVKCENCKKPETVGKDADLERLTVEELKQKQQSIIKMQKLANLVNGLGNFAQSFKQLSTPREEL
ncbi:uncharacterized protein LOC126740588 [Anthonomus grandis grandis]|uniref:uncharacterized protein LOC126740588 n=1 Tax=Anthonomus grandis grandis TaxID=2921223 RepID=UPI0021665C25|nr:uncharacterized protein LOC126740588 [Anthonomus grandis grandis]